MLLGIAIRACWQPSRRTGLHRSQGSSLGQAQAETGSIKKLRVNVRRPVLSCLLDWQPHFATFSRSCELDHNVSHSRVGECRLRRAQAMTKPVKRIPRWLTIDLMILLTGAVITIISALWLGTNIQHMMALP